MWEKGGTMQVRHGVVSRALRLAAFGRLGVMVTVNGYVRCGAKTPETRPLGLDKI
jgi:hypothetical protein